MILTLFQIPIAELNLQRKKLKPFFELLLSVCFFYNAAFI